MAKLLLSILAAKHVKFYMIFFHLPYLHPGINNHLERLLWCKITEVYYLGIDPGQSNSQISAYMVM